MKCTFYYICLSVIISVSTAQIHRATNQLSYQIRYNANFTFQYYLKRFNSFDCSRTNLFTDYLTDNETLVVWITSIIGTFFVGICGILPVVILPNLANDHQKLVNSNYFKCLVAFAAGTLLGDVFLHLLPETYTPKVLGDNKKSLNNGLWLLLGILSFLTIEKIFPDENGNTDEKNESNKKAKFAFFSSIKVVGLLNLLANVIDNFTHGIAVAGSFQASIKFGFMTLIATLLHEIPHEVGDFVILLKSGLDYRKAAMAQLTTAFSGITGAIFALASTSAEHAGDVTSWILPFTSGGFLYISLINIMPEILKESNSINSIKQIISLLFGIYLIYVLSFLFE